MRKRRIAYSSVCIVLVAVYSAYALLRPLPALAFASQPLTINTKANDISWPSAGQSAIGAVGYGVLDHHEDDTAVPTASTAKLMTALMVLKAKPLSANENGPTISITQTEVDAYQRYIQNGSSTVAVEAGENLTEYQALQAMLLPSANNIADLLAVWAYGSMEAYATAANAYAKELGMANSSFGKVDASGLDPSSVSTASDLVRLGVAAAKNPVVAQIASQKTASIPVAGTINNVNFLLGVDDIDGLKTGNTDEAGGVFVFSAKKQIGSKAITVVGAVAAAPTLYQSMKSAQVLLQSATANFREVTAVKSGQNIGSATAANKATTTVRTQTALSGVVWLPALQQPKVSWKPNVNMAVAKQSVGTVNWQTPAGTQRSSIVTEHAIAVPSAAWRLSHPL